LKASLPVHIEPGACSTFVSHSKLIFAVLDTEREGRKQGEKHVVACNHPLLEQNLPAEAIDKGKPQLKQVFFVLRRGEEGKNKETEQRKKKVNGQLHPAHQQGDEKIL
jgi:hypothetical protein